MRSIIRVVEGVRPRGARQPTKYASQARSLRSEAVAMLICESFLDRSRPETQCA